MRSFLWVIEMVAKTDIRLYIHTNNSAPQLTNNFGCMLNVLDAALINGIQVGTVSSLTASSKIVTAVFGTAHNLMRYQVIKITGANQAEYNVEARILTVPNATTITFELAAVPSVGIATGTISCSLPPLGWEKPFSSTSATGGKGAYRSKNLLLPSRPFLRVVDELDPAYTSTYAKFAKVGIVEDMTDIDTMLGVQAPYDSANPNKNWVGTGSGASGYNGWAKWYYSTLYDMSQSNPNSSTPSNGSRAWILVGSGDYFYFLPSSIPSNNDLAVYGFGEFKSYLNTDNSNTFLCSHLSYLPNNAGQGVPEGLGSQTSGSILIQREYSQASNFKTATCVSITGGLVVTGYSNIFGGINLTNNALFFPVFLKEDSNNVLRGEMQNLFWLYHQAPYTHLQTIEKKNSIFIAVNVGVKSGYKGQIILKLGDL